MLAQMSLSGGRPLRATPLRVPTPRWVLRRFIVLQQGPSALSSLVFAQPSVFKLLAMPPAGLATAVLDIKRCLTTPMALATQQSVLKFSLITLPVPATLRVEGPPFLITPSVTTTLPLVEVPSIVTSPANPTLPSASRRFSQTLAAAPTQPSAPKRSSAIPMVAITLLSVLEPVL